MAKRIIVLTVLFLSVVWLFPAESYTVVMKSGKVMEGTLISETQDTIVFKDSKGLQFSLKKTSLDLEKMAAANAPPPPPVVEPQQPEQKAEPAKPARVYTQQDIQAMRDKYGSLSTARGSLSSGLPTLGDNATPEEYASLMHEAGNRIVDIAGTLTDIADGLKTANEVAASTGKDTVEAVSLKQKSLTSDMRELTGLIDDLGSTAATLPAAPKGLAGTGQNMKSGADSLSKVLDLLTSFDGSIPFSQIEAQVRQLLESARGDGQYLTQVSVPQTSPPQPVEENSDQSPPPEDNAPQ